MKGFIYIIVVFLLFSCDQEDVWDCIQSEGDLVQITKSFENDIYHFKIHDDINIVLHDSESQRIDLVAGKNMVPEIKFSLIDGVLTVENQNSCRWTRPSQRVALHIYTDTLELLENRGYGHIHSVDTLTYSFRIWNFQPGEIDLKLTSDAIGFELHALTNVYLEGTIGHLGIFMGERNDGIVRAENLNAITSTVNHNGYNAIHVNAQQEIQYLLNGPGNIIIYREPERLIEVERNGTGRIIRNY